jgi:hypothetical protein
MNNKKDYKEFNFFVKKDNKLFTKRVKVYGVLIVKLKKVKYLIQESINLQSLKKS